MGEGAQSRGSSLGCRGARGLEFLPEEEEACASASRSRDGVSSPAAAGPGQASSRVESVPLPCLPPRGEGPAFSLERPRSRASEAVAPATAFPAPASGAASPRLPPRPRLVSTFGPARYNPAAPREGGAWAPAAGGERGGPGGRGSAAGARQAGAPRRRGRSLFVLGPPGPALLLPPMGGVRAAEVLACARVRVRLASGAARGAGGAPAPGSSRKPCERAARAPVGTPGAAGARGLPEPHLVCGCSAPPRRPPSSRPRGEQRSTRRTRCGDLPAGPSGVPFSGPRFEDRLSLLSFSNE